MTALLAAVAALTLLTLVPGPDLAVVTRVALASGRGAAARTAAGIVAGLLVWGLLTVAGLAALLAASAEAYALVKLAGAAYLVFLGVQTLWRSRRSLAQESVAVPPRAERPWRTGLVTNLVNPKIAVFYTGLLPQLVPAGAPAAPTLGALVLVHAGLSLAWLNLYALLLHRASATLQRPRVRRALDQLTGLVLVGFGLRVATQSR